MKNIFVFLLSVTLICFFGNFDLQAQGKSDDKGKGKDKNKEVV
ncbi:MAG: hypothetical protein ACI81T_002229 [Bacteroidia bacterium]|jgi:hypothetical protein